MREILYQRGLYLPGLDLWLDAKEPKALSFVSHAHSDHIARHQRIVATPETCRLLEARLAPCEAPLLHAFNEPFAFGRGRARLLSAGHIFGSAQFFWEDEEGSLLYTGDFKLRESRSAQGCGCVKADVLVMETTFGVPKYVLPPQENVEADVVRFCTEALSERKTPVLLSYSLGKTQEAVWMFLEKGFTPMLHPQAYRMTELCRSLGSGTLAGYLPLDEACLEGKVVILPPGKSTRAWLQKREGRIRSAVLTGWAMEAGAQFRSGTNAAFAWSDHADYPDLVRYVEMVEPRVVYTVHGFASEFATDLRRRGIEAWALSQENQLELGF